MKEEFNSYYFETARVRGLLRCTKEFCLTISQKDGKCYLDIIEYGEWNKKTFKNLRAVKTYLSKEYGMSTQRIDRIVNGQGYIIEKNENGEEYIQCSKCGMKSYHPQDIEKKYCGKCHEFLENKNVEEKKEV